MGEAGVIGYPAKKSQPLANAPRTMAVAPSVNSRSIIAVSVIRKTSRRGHQSTVIPHFRNATYGSARPSATGLNSAEEVAVSCRSPSRTRSTEVRTVTVTRRVAHVLSISHWQSTRSAPLATAISAAAVRGFPVVPNDEKVTGAAARAAESAAATRLALAATTCATSSSSRLTMTVNVAKTATTTPTAPLSLFNVRLSSLPLPTAVPLSRSAAGVRLDTAATP